MGFLSKPSSKIFLQMRLLSSFKHFNYSFDIAVGFLLFLSRTFFSSLHKSAKFCKFFRKERKPGVFVGFFDCLYPVDRIVFLYLSPLRVRKFTLLGQGICHYCCRIRLVIWITFFGFCFEQVQLDRGQNESASVLL